MKRLLLCAVIIASISAYGGYYENFKSGDSKKLIMLLDSLEKQKADVPCSLFFYAAELMDNVSRSVGCYTQIVNFRTDSPFYNISQLRLAKYYIIMSDSSKSLNYLRRIIYSKDSVLSPLAYVSIIGVYEKLGDMNSASNYISEFSSVYPKSQFIMNYSVDKKIHIGSSEIYYAIQIGSFKNSENADKMVNEYKAKHYEVYKMTIEGMNKVWVGKFKDEGAAKAFLKVFQKAETVPAWIVKAD